MDLDEIEEFKKRVDFNRTEPEVVIELVKDAVNKGDKVREENHDIKEKAKEILQKLTQKEKILFTEADIDPELDFSNNCSIGIDGSFFAIGGVGGKWYTPYAIVRILFDKGIENEPEIDVYAAGIEEIIEQEHYSIEGEAGRRMLIGETKALEDWGDKNKESLIFIDGPIVDPPSYNNINYIEYRCASVKKCLLKSKLIGCVKRSRDAFFIKHFENLLGMEEELQKYFPSDQHIFSYFFTTYRFKNNYSGPIFSKFLNLSDNETYYLYKNEGVNVYSVYFQKSISSKILRLDIPLRHEEVFEIERRFIEAAKATADWQYPNQYIPMPVELAHEKCKIREGAAETIYDEILARSNTGTPEDIITMAQLR